MSNFNKQTIQNIFIASIHSGISLALGIKLFPLLHLRSYISIIFYLFLLLYIGHSILISYTVLLNKEGVRNWLTVNLYIGHLAWVVFFLTKKPTFLGVLFLILLIADRIILNYYKLEHHF